MVTTHLPALVLGSGGLGNPNSADLQALPRSVGSLSENGVSAAQASLVSHSGNVAATLSQLQTNPKAYITHTFTLTALQVSALWQMSDADLADQLAPIIARIQGGDLDSWHVNFQPVKVDQVSGGQQPYDVHANALPVNAGGLHWHFTCQFTIGN